MFARAPLQWLPVMTIHPAKRGRRNVEVDALEVRREHSGSGRYTVMPGYYFFLIFSSVMSWSLLGIQIMEAF